MASGVHVWRRRSATMSPNDRNDADHYCVDTGVPKRSRLQRCDSTKSTKPTTDDGLFLPGTTRLEHGPPPAVTVDVLTDSFTDGISNKKSNNNIGSSLTNTFIISSSHSRPRFLHQLLLLLVCFCSFSVASSSLFSIPDELVEISESTSAQERLAKSGPIIADQRPPPPRANNKVWMLGSLEDELSLRKRSSNNDDDDSSSSTTTTTKSVTTTLATSASSSSTASSTSASAAATISALPTPFDSGIGTNYTDTSCSDFLTSMLDNSTFLSCVPVSLMLQNSISFFDAEKSIVTISEVLDVSCSVDVDYCNNIMTTLAANLTSAANCQTDYERQQPIVTAAELGLLAYLPIYQATCLRDNSTSAYCFAEAITNASSPTDSYTYYLPLNVSLPGGSQPTCNTCLQDTMAVFDSAASNRSSAIANTYVSAAELINMQCGPSFVNETLPVAITSAAAASSAWSTHGVVALAMVVAAWLM